MCVNHTCVRAYVCVNQVMELHYFVVKFLFCSVCQFESNSFTQRIQEYCFCLIKKNYLVLSEPNDALFQDRHLEESRQRCFRNQKIRHLAPTIFKKIIKKLKQAASFFGWHNYYIYFGTIQCTEINVINSFV